MKATCTECHSPLVAYYHAGVVHVAPCQRCLDAAADNAAEGERDLLDQRRWRRWE